MPTLTWYPSGTRQPVGLRAFAMRAPRINNITLNTVRVQSLEAARHQAAKKAGHESWLHTHHEQTRVSRKGLA